MVRPRYGLMVRPDIQENVHHINDINDHNKKELNMLLVSNIHDNYQEHEKQEVQYKIPLYHHHKKNNEYERESGFYMEGHLTCKKYHREYW